jgi:TetR/AcrR family transcriptional regulator, tetracycline repressor protein
MAVKPSARDSSRRRGRPSVISRESVLSEALRIVDAEGLERLTMRRLGAELGVDPMAVYHHVPDKAALFDGLVERVFSEVRVPARTGNWEVDFRECCEAVRDTFRAHANAMPLIGTRPAITEPAFDLVEAVTAPLLDAGFSEQDAADGVDCAGRLVIGHVLAEVGRPPDRAVDGGEVEHEEAQRALAPERYPSLAATVRAGVEHDPARLFGLALDGLVLALRERLSAATATAADARPGKARPGKARRSE